MTSHISIHALITTMTLASELFSLLVPGLKKDQTSNFTEYW
jgi:hypothetical protein